MLQPVGSCEVIGNRAMLDAPDPFDFWEGSGECTTVELGKVEQTQQSSLLMDSSSSEVMPLKSNLTKSAAHFPMETTEDPTTEAFPTLTQVDGDGDDFKDSEKGGLIVASSRAP